MSSALNQLTENLPRAKIALLLAAVMLAAWMLWDSLRGIDWKTAWSMIRHARVRFLAAGAAISSVSLLLRSLRWCFLLRSQRPIGISPVFWATSAGYFGNNFLPARAGELIRTLMISSRLDMSAMFVLTTALAERISDAIALVLISTVTVLGLPSAPGWLGGAARSFAIVGFSAAVVMGLAPLFEGTFKRILCALPMTLPIRARAMAVLTQIVQAFRAFHDLPRFLTFVGLTGFIWFSDATATIVGARALGLDFSYALALLLIAGLGLGSALPSTPGYIGIYQFVAVSVLVPFGITRTEAIAYILVVQAIFLMVIGLWGGLGLWKFAKAGRGFGKGTSKGEI